MKLLTLLYTSTGIFFMKLIMSLEYSSAATFPFSTSLNFPVVLLSERQECLQTMKSNILEFKPFHPSPGLLGNLNPTQCAPSIYTCKLYLILIFRMEGTKLRKGAYKYLLSL